MKRIVLSILFIFIAGYFASSCGYDGSYRYSCQDPENWGTKECEPPICLVDGNCTETLLGWNPTETTVDTASQEENIAP